MPGTHPDIAGSRLHPSEIRATSFSRALRRVYSRRVEDLAPVPQVGGLHDTTLAQERRMDRKIIFRPWKLVIPARSPQSQTNGETMQPTTRLQ